jgi:hypothetical protein
MNRKVNAQLVVESIEVLDCTDADIETLRAELPACAPQTEVIEKAAHNLRADACTSLQGESHWSDHNVFLLESQTIRQLKALASAAHIKGYGDMRKAQLVQALT